MKFVTSTLLRFCGRFSLGKQTRRASFSSRLTMFASYAILLGSSAAVTKTWIQILQLLRRFKRICRALFFHFSYTFVRQQSRDKNALYYTPFDIRSQELSCDG